jgi:energy-coupling factor transporter ATP-binding protein EcfA2
VNVEAVVSCAECGRPPEEGVIGWSREAEKFLCAICDGWSRNGDAPHPSLTDLREREARLRAGGTDPVELAAPTSKELHMLPDPPQSEELLGSLLVRKMRLVLGGHTGEGKSTFALALARAVTEQSDFLGFTGGGGRALIIDAEQGLKTIKRRLREAGLAESEQIHWLRVPDGLALNSNDQHAGALEAVFDSEEYTLVVADPLYKLHTGDSNAEREAVDLMKRFDAWRDRYGFALVLPVHCRKPMVGAKFTMHEFFGSSAYLRGAEVVVGLQRLSDGYSRLHFFKDRDGDLPVGESWGLIFDREQGFRRDPDDGKAKRTAADQIRELLAEEPGLTEEQLNARTGYAERTIRRALRDIGAESIRPGSTGQKQFELPSTEELPVDA